MTEGQWKALKPGDTIQEGKLLYTVVGDRPSVGHLFHPKNLLCDKENRHTWDYEGNCTHYRLVSRRAETLTSGSDHYKQTKFQPLEVILEWQNTWPVNVRFHLGCILKYLGRLGRKDEALMELKKIKHYAEEAIRVLETQVSK